MRFRFQRLVPPGGWYFYLVPETEAMFREPTLEGVRAVVVAHLKSNRLPVPEDLTARIEDYICRHVPPGFCDGKSSGPRARTVTLAQIREKTAALVSAGGRVTPGEARLRLGICGQCKSNDRRVCPSCVGLVGWCQRLVGRTCPGDEWLGVCAVDAVALTAKIHVAQVPADEAYPANCWVGRS